MDVLFKIQGSIHLLSLINNICPGKDVYIRFFYLFLYKLKGMPCQNYTDIEV